ncbi:MAG: transcription antitermination factor NusB [Gammaproteobacteria bacterium]|jgi:N utilization substance protein B|nr:transcription antitermination factor NusB [Gammaproteobacteria bacterium]
MADRVDPRARRRARRALVQALYQWQLASASAASIIDQFRAGESLGNADDEFFEDCLRGTMLDVNALELCFAEYLNRTLDQLDKVERAILRAGTFELKHRLDVPFKVVIDEYVRLAKTFGAAESHRFVNGVLDRVARDLRDVERV